MKASLIVKSLEVQLEDVMESLTLTWDPDSNSGHNQKWITLLSKKYYSEIGEFQKEIDIKTSKGHFWILVYEKAAFAGKTTRPGVGSVTHYGNVAIGKQKGRWSLNHDNTITSSEGFTLYPIPNDVKSAKRLIDIVRDNSPTSSVKVGPDDAKTTPKNDSSAIVKTLKADLPTVLPPHSEILFNEKKGLVLVKDAMGRQRFGAAYNEVEGGVYNVIVQEANQKTGQKVPHVIDPAPVITSRFMDYLNDQGLRSEFANSIIALSFKGSEYLTRPESGSVVVSYKIGSVEMVICTIFYRNNTLAIFDALKDKESRVRVNLNDIQLDLVQKEFDKLLNEETPIAQSVIKKWDDVDDAVDFKHVVSTLYKLMSKKKHIGYARIKDDRTVFMTPEGKVFESLDNSTHSCLGVVDRLAKNS